MERCKLVTPPRKHRVFSFYNRVLCYGHTPSYINNYGLFTTIQIVYHNLGVATLSSTKLNPSSTYLGLEQFVPWKGMKWVERHFGITSHPRVNLYIHQRQAVTRIRFQQFAEQLFQFYNKVTRVKGTICSYSYSFLSQW